MLFLYFRIYLYRKIVNIYAYIHNIMGHKPLKQW